MSFQDKLAWIMDLFGQMGAAFVEIGAIIVEIIKTVFA